ncbi:MAG TPA: hypothetical protein EYH12_00950 [Psychromonas hadalis]|nr:hypothetical protein [Psychromonas hadalis]
MTKKFKIDGAQILSFLRTRKLILESKYNNQIFDIELLWFLVIMIFLSGFIFVGAIIALLLGCKISLIDSNDLTIEK